MAGLRNKDEGFWKGLKEWDVVFMFETWVEKKDWGKIKGKLPRGYKWEMQEAKRRSERGRASGGMVVGIRKEIEVGREGNGTEETGVVVRTLKIRKEKWRIVGMYVNGD